MEEIFADFKRGVNEELSAGDMETRFDLGIEMLPARETYDVFDCL